VLRFLVFHRAELGFLPALHSHFFFFRISRRQKQSFAIMSEESKIADGDYVMMGAGSVVPGRSIPAAGLDDPSLSQEEKDHRLAVAIQQQENAAAYSEHKKKHAEHVHAQQNRTARSGTFTKLAAVRSKDHGMFSVPAEYTSEMAYHRSDNKYAFPGGNDKFSPPPQGASPQEIADHQMAANLQKFEQVDAGTIRTMTKIVTEETEAETAQAHRTQRSNYHINQKGFPR
jgi:hypothetical protein